MVDFELKVRSTRSFDDAVQAVLDGVAAEGFRALYTHDVQSTLAEKGFEFGPLKIIEVCNAKHAFDVLSKDVSIALMLPCPIAVYEKDGEVYVTTMRPSAIASFYPDAHVEPQAQAVEDVLSRVIDGAR